MKSIREIRESYLPECVYCGEPATTRDHIPPKRYKPFNTKTVPACRRCNIGILNSLHLLTLKERKDYVKKVLKQHGKHWLRPRTD